MTRKMVKRETASVYVDYFLKEYKINKNYQLNLKEAILKACENPKLPINAESLNLNEKNRICVNDLNERVCVDISTVHKNVNSLCDFVELIVEKIMDLENIELLNLRTFTLERKMDFVLKHFEDMGIYPIRF